MEGYIQYESLNQMGIPYQCPIAKQKVEQKEGKGGMHNGQSGGWNCAIAASFIYFLRSAPTPAAIPVSTGVATPIASVGTNTALFPNAATRLISCLRRLISCANSSATSASARALMRVAAASASAASRVACACASASSRVRSATAFAAATVEYAS